MTEPVVARCAWCGRGFTLNQRGRPRRFCKPSHRQRAYEARRLGDEHRLGPDDVIISRDLFERLRDGLYLLASAMDDVDADLAAPDGASHREALWHLYRSAAELRSIAVEPRALGERSITSQ